MEEVKPHTINLLLLGVSLTILGVLGLIFITQMEVQPGWQIEFSEGRNAEYEILNGSDISGDGIFDVLCYSHNSYYDARLPNVVPQFGSITMLNGKTGGELWKNLYDGPIKRAFRIFDVNSDGHSDFFACKAKVEPEWDNDKAEVIHNNFSNFLLSGDDGLPIEVEHGIDQISFSNYFVMDLVCFDDLEDEREDIICLEYIYNNESSYYVNITSYFVNGTMVNYTNIIAQEPDYESNDILPQIELFSYGGETHLLLVDADYVQLINLSTSDYSREVFKADIVTDWSFNVESYEIVEDLDLNGVPEIIVSDSSGSMILINGTDGTYLTTYNTSYSFSTHEVKTTELSNQELDGSTYIVSKIRGDSNIVAVYKVNSTNIEILWDIIVGESQFGGFALGTDLNGDTINDVVIIHSILPFGSMSEVKRYRFVNALNGQEFWQINTDRELRTAIVSSDIDGDGLPDIVGAADSNIVIAFSVAKPVDLWLSAKYSYGFLLFIACVAFLIIGILLLARYGTKLRFNLRKSFKENKMTVAVNVFTIVVMSITFILFMFMINIFNSTLIAEAPMTRIIVAFLTVSIMWYTLLPLTAAIYNQFAPRFAYLIVKLRELFFKISKSYEHDILILDMGNRKDINNLIKIKRVILPMLLSITVGFLVYNYAAPLYGYAQNFTQFGSTQFFSFIAGYSLFCTFPMILSFSIFSFFIAGNYLLDDAGVVYYRESNKHRSPGDIEPISIWAQSMIKGFAGLSALITFSGFFASVDFSGFFTMDDQGIFFVIFGAFMVITMFWGNPFITSFSYILLAEEVMELSINTNVKKLHKIMEKKGYDVNPRKLTHLYPADSISPKKTNTIDTNLPKDDE